MESQPTAFHGTAVSLLTHLQNSLLSRKKPELGGGNVTHTAKEFSLNIYFLLLFRLAYFDILSGYIQKSNFPLVAFFVAVIMIFTWYPSPSSTAEPKTGREKKSSNPNSEKVRKGKKHQGTPQHRVETALEVDSEGEDDLEDLDLGDDLSGGENIWQMLEKLKPAVDRLRKETERLKRAFESQRKQVDALADGVDDLKLVMGPTQEKEKNRHSN